MRVAQRRTTTLAGVDADRAVDLGVDQSAGHHEADLADPFRALRYPALLLTGLTSIFYHIGFFTILAAGQFALPEATILQIGWVFFGWGLLLAFTSVFVAPVLQRRIGTVPSVIAMLVLFALDLAMIAVFTSDVPVVAGIVLSGAFIGVNNTLITEIVMGAAPVERPVASAAYSFLRFCGGAVGLYVALKLGEHVNLHAPFWFGAGAVAVGVVILVAGRRLVAGTATPETHAFAEAEAELVGDLA